MGGNIVKPVKITIEHDDGTKQVLEDDVDEWLSLMGILINIAAQQGVDIYDFDWKEEEK